MAMFAYENGIFYLSFASYAEGGVAFFGLEARMVVGDSFFAL